MNIQKQIPAAAPVAAAGVPATPQTPAAKPAASAPAASLKADQVSTQSLASSLAAVNIGQDPIRAQLRLQISDRDGLAQFSQGDIKALISGGLEIDPEFILDKLRGIKSNEDTQFGKPSFDPKRQQYVIRGKALDKILGFIDVGFEIRLGATKGQLSFHVDSGLKRGPIFGTLKDMLAKAGLQTERRGDELFIVPSYGKPIDLPLSEDHPGRIDQLHSSAQNLSFDIDKAGKIRVSLNQVQADISSDAKGAKNPALPSPDKADLRLSLGFDKELHPSLQLQDGKLETTASARTLKGLVPEKTLAPVQEQLGNSMNVGLSHLKGTLRSGPAGLQVQAQGQLSVREQGAADPAHLETALSVSLTGGNKSPNIQARNLNLQTREGQKLSAAGIGVQLGEQGQTIHFDKLDGQVHVEGVQADLDQLSGQVSLGKGGALSVDANGRAKGRIDKPGIQAEFETQGQHTVSKNGASLKVHLDQAQLKGGYQMPDKQAPLSGPAAKASDPAQPMSLELGIDDLQAEGQFNTPDIQVSGKLDHNRLNVVTGANKTRIQTVGSVSAEAKGERINGKLAAQGTSIALPKQGGAQIQLENHQIDGSFSNRQGKLKISGHLAGDASIQVKPGGQVQVDNTGSFVAGVNSQNRIKVDGHGGDAHFAMDADQNVDLRVEDMDIQTRIATGQTRVNAHSKGEKARLQVKGDKIDIQTEQAKSDVDVKIKTVVQGGGKVGDVHVSVDESGKDDKIDITAKDAKVKARIQNAKGNLQVGVDTKADLSVGIHGDDDISISSRRATTKANVELKNADGSQTKIKASAQGQNFNVGVHGDDIDIKVDQANYQGLVTPNPRIRVDVGSTGKAPLKVSVRETDDNSHISVASGAPIKGNVSVNGKLQSDFTNPQGFTVDVDDKAKSSDIRTEVRGLKLQGQVDAGPAQARIDGQGDFNLRIADDDNIFVNYDGRIDGQAAVKGSGDGSFSVKGKVRVGVQNDDIEVKAQGPVELQGKAPGFGAQGKLSISEGPQGLTLSLKGNKVNLDLPAGGYVQLDNPQQLNIGGKESGEIREILAKLHSKSVKIEYQDLKLRDGAQSVGVALKTSNLDTEFGKVAANLVLDKEGEQVDLTGGKIVLQPNIKLYELVRDGLAKKYNINIQGQPSFENGELRIKGEIRTKSGLTQLANFNVKATVHDNKLVFDIDKANVLKVFGSNTVGTVLNKVLSHTDIDFFKRGNHSVEIALADIVKDLSLTQGVNFTDLKLVDNRFEVGFYYSAQDQKISQLAGKKDVAGLKQLLAQKPLSEFSEESLATVYNTYAAAKDIPASTDLLEKVMRSYEQPTNAANKYQMDRALHWMIKSKPATKADIEDNIALELAKRIKPGTTAGDALIRKLPFEVVGQWADNLDKTITQGGSWGIISAEERETANRLRSVVNLPLNHRPF